MTVRDTEGRTESDARMRVELGLGMAARQKGDHAAALRHFMSAAALAPDKADVQIRIVHALIALERAPEAAEYCDRVVRKMPRYAGAIFASGLVAREMGDLDAALARMRRAAALRPEQSAFGLEIAWTLHMMGDLGEAATGCRTIIGKEPRHFEALALLGAIEHQLGGEASARRQFERAAGAELTHPGIAGRIAQVLRACGRTEEAAEIYRKMLAQNPRHGPAIEALAAILGTRQDSGANGAEFSQPADAQVREAMDRGLAARKRGEHATALAHFETAATLKPRNADLQLEIATTLRFLRRYPEAIDRCHDVLEETAQHDVALFTLGQIARDSQDHDGALEHFRKAAAMKPRNRLYRSELAQALYRLDRLTEARASCEDVLAEDPRRVSMLFLLGAIECRLDDLSAARRWFALAMEIDPQDLDLRERIARTLNNAGWADHAAEVYRDVLARDPQRDRTINGLASILSRRRTSPQAAQELAMIAASAPANVEVRLALAGLTQAHDRLEEAETAYRGVLSLSEGNLQAVLGLADVARAAADLETSLARLRQAACLAPDDPFVRFTMARALFDLLRREEAESLVQECEDDPRVNRDPRYQLARFRYFCQTLQLDRAGEAAARWSTHRDIPGAAVGDVASLLALRGDWDRIIELVRDRITDRMLPDRADVCGILLESFGRAVRHAGKYDEALALTEAWPHRATREMVADIRDRFVEERLLMDALGSTGGERSDVGPRLRSALRAERHAIRSAILSDPAEAPVAEGSSPAAEACARANPLVGRATIYYCADAKYLVGAAVSLFSLLRNNDAARREWDFVIYCSSEVIALASEVFRAVGSCFGARIDVRDAADLLPQGANFRTLRGLTGLVRLSDAAYFRIYAALQFIREKRGRALYIDSDTCVGPGIDDLLQFDFSGQPLAAMWESVSRRGARRATKRLGVDPGKYFNSGVMLFDLTNPQIEEALLSSIDVALNQQHLLIFLDQDCLNAGFKGRTVRLPETYNHLLAEHDAAPAVPPVVTHYIAHPKPWDPAYKTGHCRPWFDEFAGLGRTVGPDLTRRLLRHHFIGADAQPANGQAPASAITNADEPIPARRRAL